MGTLFIGAHLIGNFVETPIEWFGHYFLLYSEDDVPSGDDQIIRAGQDNGLIVLQFGIDYSASVDDPTYWGNAAGTSSPEEYYGYTALDTGYRDAESVWSTLLDLSEQIESHQIDYNRLTQNSNSVVSSLLHAVDVELVSPEISNGSSYTYPGSGRLLTADWLTNYAYSYVIRGNDLDSNDAPVDDVLRALTSNAEPDGDGDYVVGFAGDDVIYDGRRNDVLDGGAGDDEYYLEIDGEADVIIVGEGSDYILGGDANDRIVVRASLLGLDPQLQNWTNPPSGLQSSTQGVPLLGGFTIDDPRIDASYTFIAEEIVVTQYQLPEDPNVYNEYWVDYKGDPLWEEFVGKNVVDEGAEVGGTQMKSVFSVDYDIMQTPWNTTALLIEIHHFVNGTRRTDDVFIDEFEEGDFGIYFAERSSFEVPVDAGGGTLTYNDPTHVAQINNYGAYITIPEIL